MTKLAASGLLPDVASGIPAARKHTPERLPPTRSLWPREFGGFFRWAGKSAPQPARRPAATPPPRLRTAVSISEFGMSGISAAGRAYDAPGGRGGTDENPTTPPRPAAIAPAWPARGCRSDAAPPDCPATTQSPALPPASIPPSPRSQNRPDRSTTASHSFVWPGGGHPFRHQRRRRIVQPALRRHRVGGNDRSGPGPSEGQGGGRWCRLPGRR